ncbi:MAG TPA: hypothetical protein VMV18_01930 [bacterium]|nr:hypothetical protein [bacterium]
MSVEPESPGAQESARAALYDPDLREWPSPGGVRAEPAGLRASFQAMGMRSVVEEEAGAVLFEAWRTPRVGGAVVAALVAAVIYVALDRLQVGEFQILVAVVLAAFYVPTAVLPTWRVSGRVENGTVSLRVTARGLVSRRAALEAALRFYLATPAS